MCVCIHQFYTGGLEAGPSVGSSVWRSWGQQIWSLQWMGPPDWRWRWRLDRLLPEFHLLKVFKYSYVLSSAHRRWNYSCYNAWMFINFSTKDFLISKMSLVITISVRQHSFVFSLIFSHGERAGENCDWTKLIWLALIGQIPPGGQKLQISTCGCAGRRQQIFKNLNRYVGNSIHFYTQSSLIHCFLQVEKK